MNTPGQDQTNKLQCFPLSHQCSRLCMLVQNSQKHLQNTRSKYIKQNQAIPEEQEVSCFEKRMRDVEDDQMWMMWLPYKHCLQNTKNQYGYGLLQFACLFDLPFAVEQIIKAGVEVSQLDEEGNQALHIASTHSSMKIVEMLLRHTSTGLTVNKVGKTAFDLAVQHEREEVAFALLPFLGESRTHHPLCTAIVYRRKSILIALLIRQRFNHFYCYEHDLPLVVIALLRGGGVWPRRVRQNKDSDCLEVIFKYINSVYTQKLNIWFSGLTKYQNVQNDCGNSLLHFATLHKSLNVVQYLLDSNVEVLQNIEGDTALHVSCLYGRTEITELFLSKGVYAYTLNKRHLCPMACAVGNGRLDTLKILLKYGINPTCDPFVQSPCSLPVAQVIRIPLWVSVFCSQATPLLLQHGAYVNISIPGKKVNTLVALLAKLIKMLNTSTYSSHWKTDKASMAQLMSAGACFCKTDRSTNSMMKCASRIGLLDKDVMHCLVNIGHSSSVTDTESSEERQVRYRVPSLECISSHTIRINLTPNAWVSVKMLPVPMLLKRIIIMDSSFVTFSENNTDIN